MLSPQYGITFWGQTYDSYLEPISKLQKKAVRAISHQPFRSPSLLIFKKLKLIRFQDIFQLRLLTFVYKSINKKNPSCFHDYFSINANIHQHSIRQSNRSNLCLTHRNSFRYGLKSFRYKGAKLWNGLPVEIRNSPSKYSFKINFETFLQNNIVINDGFLNLVYK